MPRLNPTAIALIGGIALVLLIVLLFASRGNEDQDKLIDNQLATSASTDPEKRCAAQSTYDLIKRELFRRAARVRGSDQGAFDRLAAYSVLRMDAPMLRSHDEDAGAVNCSGTLSLDLPPGVAVVGGRRTLMADITYAIQPAADGSGSVLTLGNADSIVTPLATLARTGAPAADPLAPTDMSTADGNVLTPLPEPMIPQPDADRPRPEPAPSARANPSFNCGAARTRGEIAVCNDPGLAALDRQMASQFNRAMGDASSSERALLERTRARFLSYRDGCRSDDCIADAYRGRMREIGDIMAGRWQGR